MLLQKLETSLVMTSQQISIHFLNAVSMQAVKIALHHSDQNDHDNVTDDFICTV